MGYLLGYGARGLPKRLTGRCTITRESGRGRNAARTTIAVAEPYRRDDPARVRLEAMAGGVQAVNRETLYVQRADVRPLDLVVDDADPTLRFLVDAIGESTEGVLHTLYATRAQT